jgi:Flp pilus assembly protein CpaB
VSWPAEASPPRVDRWLRELRRAVAWRRRLLSAGLLAGSVAFALQALAPAPPPGVDVVVASRDVAAGSTLQARDLRVVSRPVGSVPEGSLTSYAGVAGRAVASAVRRGEVLTDVRLVGPSSLRGLGAGVVAAPVRVADAQSATLLQPGDVVDVLAAAPAGGGFEARLVASGARVLSVPRADAGELGAGLGDGGLVLLATSAATASRLAAAAVTDRLSVVLRAP